MRHIGILILLVLIAGCQSRRTTPVTVATPPLVATPIAQLPLDEPAARPVPLGAAAVVELEGETVLASQYGLYQARLKPAGPNLSIELVKAGTLDDPPYETSAVSGPAEFAGRILQDLDRHPEFISPLVTVLEAASDESKVQALRLDQVHLQEVKLLLEAVGSSR